MGLLSPLYKWMFKSGLRNFLRSKGQSTGSTGNTTSFDGWETVLGQAGMLKDYGNVWGSYGDKDSELSYEECTVVFACIRTILESFPEAILEFGKDNAEGEFESIENEEARVLQLVNCPNPDMNQQDFFEYWLAHLLLTGKSFVWKWRNAMGEVAEMYPIPSHWVEINPAKKPSGDVRFIQGFWITPPGTGKKTYVKPGDMIYHKYINPVNFIEGVGPLEAAFRSYSLDRGREDYIKEMMDAPVAGMHILGQDEWSDDLKSEVRRAIQEAVGIGKRGSPLFLGGEGVQIEYPAPLKDYDWKGLQASTESRICMAFGVPPLMIHARVAMENTPLSSPNVEAAEKIFYRRTMQFHWRSIASALTKGLLRDEREETGYFLYDTAKVKAMAEDYKTSSELLERVAPLGILLKNEARQLIGFEPRDEFEDQVITSMAFLDVPPEDADANSEEEKNTHTWEENE